MIVDQHEIKVYSGATELEPLQDAGTITADRGWSPHVQGRLSVRTPADFDLTEPGTALTIELTQRFGAFDFVRDMDEFFTGATLADADTHLTGYSTLGDLDDLLTGASWNTPHRPGTGRTFELYITERTRTRDTHELTLASMEALVQDWVWYAVDGNREGVPLTFSAHTPYHILLEIFAAHQAANSGADLSVNLINEATPRELTTYQHSVDAGEGTLSYAQRFITQALQRLYSAGDGALRLVDFPYTHDSAIEIAQGVNLIDWEISEDRYRQKLVRFAGRPGADTASPIYSSSPFPELNWPHEEIVDADMYPLLTTGLVNGITAEVEPFTRQIGLERSPIRLVTINDYSVMPGGTVTYTLPDEDEETEQIDAISWQLGGRWESEIRI